MSFNMRPRLSVCLIVKDEARHLPGCLESVRDWADEIIVVDTGSTDATPDQARLVGATVVDFPWEGDFSKARNVALRRASGDWILSIDADERLDYVNGGRLLRLIAEAPAELDAFQLRIVSAADRIDSGVELVHFYPRLFRNRDDIAYRGALHEQVYAGERPLGLAAPKTDLSIYHIGYADPEKNEARLKRNHDIAIREADAGPANPTARLKLADTFVMVGELDKAEALYDELLAEQDLGELRANVRWNLAVCRFRSQNIDAALEQLDLAVDEFPHLTGTRFMRAQLLMEAGRHGDALTHLDDLLEAPVAHDPRLTDIRPQPAFLMTLRGICLAREGQPEASARAFDQALERDPQLFAAHCHKADQLMTLGRPEEALSAYLRAAALRPDTGNVRLRAGLILLDLGRREDGVALIREAGRLDPEAAPHARKIMDGLEREARGEPLVAEPTSELKPETTPDTGPDTELQMGSEAPVAAGPEEKKNPLLSVCLIVRDEEDALPGCLESVAAVADEIVVCDTGSTDGTMKIAGDAGAVLVEFPWCDDFSAARNAALAAASGDWILVLDADERLEAGSAGRIRDLISNGEAGGYNVSIDSATRGDLVNRFVGNYCRLFRRHPGARFEGRVHEQIYPSLSRSGLRVTASEIVIEHLGYSLDGEALVEKKRRNLALLEREMSERPDDHFVQFNLGIGYFSLHDLERAEPAFRSSVKQTHGTLPHEVQAIAHARLAQCSLGRGDMERAGADAENALAVDADASIPRFVLAMIACHDNKFEDAADQFRRILSAGTRPGDGMDRAEISRELGICLYKLQKYDEAAEAFLVTAESRPDDAQAKLFLGNALAHAGRLEPAHAAYRDAVERDPELVDAARNLEIMALEVGYQHFDAGNPDAALKLIPPDTKNTELLFLSAVSRHALEDFEGARATLLDLIAIDDSYAESHWNLALACRSLGDADGARAALERFRELAPGDDRGQALEQALATNR